MAEEIAIRTAAGLAPKAAESAYDWLKQRLSYVFKYQSYINDLKKPVEDLRNKRERVEKSVESAERQGEEIYEDVKKWLSDVDEFTERVAKAIIEDEDKANKGDCFKLGSCPNLIQRYKRGKEAVKATVDGADLLGKGNFRKISYLPPLQRTESMYVRDYETFDSREQAFQEIMKALQDVNINTIGVYGMGGVGKTTLVKKVAWEVKKNKLFDEVVIAEATQTPDYRRIQDEVAYELGLQFGQRSESERTCLLRNRIKKQKNLLLILDNVWTKLDLDAIGIPFGGVERGRDEKIRPCTILLTSRKRDLLSKDMKTQKDIFIDPLSYDDAWNFFRKIVGDDAERSDFHPVAVKIVGKCAGLPLAISTIASALKNESLHAWEDALVQLQRSNLKHIRDMDETLHSTIELSYKFLKYEEAKSLFLLCALYNAGNSVFLDDLLKYSMGLNLFGNGYTLEEGRNRLHNLIDHLKASCLLLDGSYHNTVKMHDIIHAVAVSIASAEKLMFNIQNVTDLKEVLGERISKDSTAVSVPNININDDLPERFECPKLKLLFLFCKNRSPQIPDAFFEKMKELRVLSLSGLKFLPLPSSIAFLKNLQTLSLKFDKLGDIRILGELSKLEILSLVGSDIKELPTEIGQLTRLKLLDLSSCFYLKYIAANVISFLSQLQELYMGDSFVQWEIEGVDKQGRRNASLEELKRLSNLTVLHLCIQDTTVIQHDLIFEKLKSYKIFIGHVWKSSVNSDSSISKMFKLKINDRIHLRHGVKSLLKMTEDLSLEGMNVARDVIYELSVDGFPHVKYLNVEDDLGLFYIIKPVTRKPVFPNLESLILGNLIKLKKICHGQLNAGSFKKLKIIEIEKCDRLEYLFASVIAKNLVQLQEIKVVDCKNLKEIFGKENNDHGDEIETNDKTEFSQLCSLTIQYLPKFMKISSDVRVVFPILENLIICSVNFENAHIYHPLAMFHYSQCLKSLTVKKCNDLKFLFSSSMVKSLIQLQKLVISNCESMEVIIDSKEAQKEEKIIDISFPKLMYVELEVLPKLTSFGIGNSIKFPSLKELHIGRCFNLKTFFNESFYPKTEGEPKEEVNPENFFIDIDPLFDEKVAFPSLEKMVLLHLDNLKLIWHNQKLHVESYRKLKVVRVESCEKLLTIVPSNTQGRLTFYNLESLKVENCLSLKSLFPVSIAIGLVQLKDLRINSCGLEQIVSEEEVNGNPTFLFPQLTDIRLENLQEIKCFYPRLHAIEWPMLSCLVVHNCKIKLYAYEFPSFQPIEGEGQPASISLEKNCFHNIEYPRLSQFPTLKEEIWNDGSPVGLFCNLKWLVLDEVSDMSSAFPFHAFNGLRNLETLEVRNCHSFKDLIDMKGKTLKSSNEEILGFKNLKSLEVHNCSSLRYIFTPSIILGLDQLQRIKVKNCVSIEEIITKDEGKWGAIDEIFIPNLSSIFLELLPNLASFYSGTNYLECPSLNSIDIINCRKMETFVFSDLKTDHFDHNESLFNEKVAFPSLDYMELYNFQLKKIVLSSLEPCFQNLSILYIDGSDNLQYLFPSSTVKSLFKLSQLVISNCLIMERVIDENEGRIETMLFPKLYELNLIDLPKLTTFCYSTANSIEMSSLSILGIDNCPRIQTFISNYVYGDMTLSNKEPEEMSAKENSIQIQSLFDQKVRLPSLKKLEISHANRLVKLWNNQISLDSLSELDWLSIRFCKNLASVFPSNMFGKHQKLKILEVHNCDSVEEIFEVLEKRPSMMKEVVAKGEAVPRLVFSNLTKLHLDMLPSLKSFYPDMHISEWPILEELTVYGCNNVEILASEVSSIRGSHGDSQPPLFFVYKDAFPHLEKLELREMPRLKHLWRGNYQPCNAFQNLETLKVSECDSLENSWFLSMSFQNLATLQVSKCDGLRYLLTPSKTKTLGRLTKINVSDCKRMEEIITHLGDEVMVNSIVFNNLDCLELHCLYNLKGFYCGNYSLEFSSLKKVIVRQCLEMETFCHGVLNTPKLERLQLTAGEEDEEEEDEVEKSWEGNLNSAIQSLYKNTKVQSSKED